jgi:hypothetical protein
MNNNLVRITKNLSFGDLKEKSPKEIYKIQVLDWIIEPSKQLSKLYPDETDHGMALLAIQLMFFEPHGQFLTGEDSLQQSKKLFVIAFNKFVIFMESRNKVESHDNLNISELFYKFARCGLFHSSIMGTEMLVSAIRIQEKVFYKNPIIGGWLVDPWLMLNELEKYLDDYLVKLADDGNSNMLENFNKTYNRLFEKHLSRFE